ncbi:hypothetical protein Poly21_54640 [Allorhodopirellula heiligendammensis]|uniref:Uncharacterized protein n=1 Tax=Allorhodopirellula heiligendammensis TaxID=2714739 RepID=A0A5C6BCM9_9BACT|nr:hypothetical protein Poly21_54640 [Allorhodopirellula heiligendammensis]
MDIDELEQVEDQLDTYLARFADCFGQSGTRAHLTTHARGQLSDLDTKSVEPIALQAGTNSARNSRSTSMERRRSSQEADSHRPI